MSGSKRSLVSGSESLDQNRWLARFLNPRCEPVHFWHIRNGLIAFNVLIVYMPQFYFCHSKTYIFLLMDVPETAL